MIVVCSGFGMSTIRLKGFALEAYFYVLAKVVEKIGCGQSFTHDLLSNFGGSALCTIRGGLHQKHVKREL
jgi:hypothetical protein